MERLGGMVELTSESRFDDLPVGGLLVEEETSERYVRNKLE
jgi:hypothetical protein